MISIVPATKEHLKGKIEGADSLTIKALAAIEDGNVIAVGGTYTSANGKVAFMKIESEMKKYPVLLFKTVKRFIAECKSVYAFCDTSIDGADRFLKHLGFERIKGDVWLLRRSQQ